MPRVQSTRADQGHARVTIQLARERPLMGKLRVRGPIDPIPPPGPLPVTADVFL